MSVIRIDDRTELARRFRQDPDLHLYELGDLDDFFWPHTTWYGLDGGDAVVLVYDGFQPATVMGLSRPDGEAELRKILTDALPLLPRRFYAHTTGGVEDVFEPAFAPDNGPGQGGAHLKLSLIDPGALRAAPEAPNAKAEPLTVADRAEVEALYAASYPGNWFDARMLETGQYMGVRRGGELVAVAGIHVYSAVHRVAALGNVTTRPDLRGSGLGSAVVSALCGRLLETVDHIGLNVKADNVAAVNLYRRLGFGTAAEYFESGFVARD
jgi:ribosomal protein S18 acetylase RimI-like enzyme